MCTNIVLNYKSMFLFKRIWKLSTLWFVGCFFNRTLSIYASTKNEFKLPIKEKELAGRNIKNLGIKFVPKDSRFIGKMNVLKDFVNP